MKAEEFKQLWIAYMQHIVSGSDWLSLWNSNSKWTEAVLKTKAFDEHHWIHSFLSQHHSKLTVQSEYRKIDFTAALSFKGKAKTMAKDGSSLKIHDAFFLDTIVEFENDFAACFQEMIKLTQLRGKLKVLVTYDYPYKDNPGTKNDWVEIARRNWRSIIRDAHSHLPEPGVEYLLAIGQLSNTESKGSNPDMTWYFTSLSTSLSEGFKDTEVKISSNQ